MEAQEQIMIFLDGLYETEDDPDLLDLLVAEPQNKKIASLNYDYQPTPLPQQQNEEIEEAGLKTSNTSTETNASSEHI